MKRKCASAIVLCLSLLLCGEPANANDANDACQAAVSQFLAKASCNSSALEVGPAPLACSSQELGSLQPVLSLSLQLPRAAGRAPYFAKGVEQFLASRAAGSWDVDISTAPEIFDLHKPLRSDVYIIPSYDLGIATGGVNQSRLAPISSALLGPISPGQINQDWYGLDKSLRLRSALYGANTASVILGGSISQLLYRYDVFDRLGIPAQALDTWAGVMEVAMNLTGRDWNGDGKPVYGFCWNRGAICGVMSVLAMAAPILQTEGSNEGMWISSRSGQLKLGSRGMLLAMIMYKKLAELTDPAEAFHCDSYNKLFMEGRCAVTFSTSVLDFKAYSQLNTSRVRGKFKATLAPGADLVWDRESGDLVPCNDSTCLYAELEGPLARTLTSYQEPRYTSPRDYTALLGLDAAMLTALGVSDGSALLGGPRLNRAPGLTGVFLGVINGDLPAAGRVQAMQLLTSLASDNSSWDAVLAESSDIAPYRFEQWEPNRYDHPPDRWTEAGYDPVALPSYLDAIRRSSNWGANSWTEPQFPGSSAALNLGAFWVAKLNAGVGADIVSKELNASFYRQAQDIYGSWNSFLWEYRASTSYQDIPRQVPRPPAPPSTPPSASNAVPLRTILIACLVPSCVLLVVVLWLLYVRNWRVHRDVLGRIRAPPAAPDTTMLVAMVQDLANVNEATLLETMPKVVEIWDALTSHLLAKHSGYQLPTSSLGCLHAAFHSPGEAAMFALQLQRMLLVAKWPRQLLEMPKYAPLYIEPTGDLLSGSHKHPRPDAQPVSPTIGVPPRSPLSFAASDGAVLEGSNTGTSKRLSLLGAVDHGDGSLISPQLRSMQATPGVGEGHHACNTFGQQCASSWMPVLSSMAEAAYLDGSVPGRGRHDSVLSEGAASTGPAGDAGTTGRPLMRVRTGSKSAPGATTPGTQQEQLQAARPQAVLVARGLQVCVSLCAVCGSEVGRTVDSKTGRVTFSGQPMQIAQCMAASGQAGMTLVPQQTFRQLPVEVMSKDNLFCHYGEYQFSPDLVSLDVYLALDKRLLGRLALFRPLSLAPEGITASPGVLAAPVDRAAMVFTHIVGVQTLLAWDYELAVQALDVFTRLAQQKLKALNGYLVEHVSGFMLSAFQEPGAAILWAMQLQEMMQHEEWNEELLAHAMCEEVIVDCEQKHGTSARGATAASEASGSHAGEARGGVVLYRGPRLKTGIDVGPILTALNTVTGRMAYRGKVMNRAARIASIASSGQVLCSAEAFNAAHGTQGINALQAQLQPAAADLPQQASLQPAPYSASLIRAQDLPASTGDLTQLPLQHSYTFAVSPQPAAAPQRASSPTGACPPSNLVPDLMVQTSASNPQIVADFSGAAGTAPHTLTHGHPSSSPAPGGQGTSGPPMLPASAPNSGSAPVFPGSAPGSGPMSPRLDNQCSSMFNFSAVAEGMHGAGWPKTATAGQVNGSLASQPSLGMTRMQQATVQAESLGLFLLKGIVERIEVFHCFYCRPHLNIVNRRLSLRAISMAVDPQHTKESSQHSFETHHSTRSNTRINTASRSSGLIHSTSADVPRIFCLERQPASDGSSALFRLNDSGVSASISAYGTQAAVTYGSGRRASWTPEKSGWEFSVPSSPVLQTSNSLAAVHSILAGAAHSLGSMAMPTNQGASPLEQIQGTGWNGGGADLLASSAPVRVPPARPTPVHLDHVTEDADEVMLSDEGADWQQYKTGRLADITEGDMEGSPRSLASLCNSLHAMPRLSLSPMQRTAALAGSASGRSRSIQASLDELDEDSVGVNLSRLAIHTSMGSSASSGDREETAAGAVDTGMASLADGISAAVGQQQLHFRSQRAVSNALASPRGSGSGMPTMSGTYQLLPSPTQWPPAPEASSSMLMRYGLAGAGQTAAPGRPHATPLQQTHLPSNPQLGRPGGLALPVQQLLLLNGRGVTKQDQGDASTHSKAFASMSLPMTTDGQRGRHPLFNTAFTASGQLLSKDSGNTSSSAQETPSGAGSISLNSSHDGLAGSSVGRRPASALDPQEKSAVPRGGASAPRAPRTVRNQGSHDA